MDDFGQQSAQSWYNALVASGQRLRSTQVHLSESMTNVILFHQSRYRTFKAYSPEDVQRHLYGESPSGDRYQGSSS